MIPYINNRVLLEDGTNRIIGLDPKVGENLGGGFVFYTGSTPGTSIIVAYGGGGLGPLLPAPSMSPPNYWFVVPPNSDEAKQFYRGSLNTNALSANMGGYPSYLFPQVVNNFTLSGYTDWKVPSLYELQEIQKYKVQLGIPNWSNVEYKVTSSLIISGGYSYLWVVRGDGYADSNQDTADFYYTTCLIRYI